MDASFWGQLGLIIWVNIILSGDNAIVIALACRGLPVEQRTLGTILGAGVAIVLRIIFTLIIAQILGVPFLRIVGGVLLLWIAVKLVTDEADESDISSSDKLWKAVQTIAIADVVMSLDNVLAIAAVAKDNYTLLILGLLISIPMIVFGAQLILKVLERFPIIVWAGAALLGWLAGDMIAKDKFTVGVWEKLNPAWVQKSTQIGGGLEPTNVPVYTCALIGVAIVLSVAYYIKQKHHKA